MSEKIDETQATCPEPKIPISDVEEIDAVKFHYLKNEIQRVINQVTSQKLDIAKERQYTSVALGDCLDAFDALCDSTAKAVHYLEGVQAKQEERIAALEKLLSVTHFGPKSPVYREHGLSTGEEKHSDVASVE